MSFSLDSLLSALNVPSGEISPTCVCGVPVRHYRDTCDNCKATQRKADRRLLLGASLRSLPAMPWAFWVGDWAQTCDEKILAALGRWVRAKGNLVLCGPTGCGKTTASVARIRKLLAQAEQPCSPEDFRFACGIRFAGAADLATARKQHPLGSGEPFVIEEAIDASLLILDELGYESQQDTAIPELADIRYRKGRLTITTTGLRPAEMVARYGEATVRKLIGQGKIVSAFEDKQS